MPAYKNTLVMSEDRDDASTSRRSAPTASRDSGAYRPELVESRSGFGGTPLPGGLVVVMSTSNGSSAPTAGTEARED
jgi:hypothetical protein